MKRLFGISILLAFIISALFAVTDTYASASGRAAHGNKDAVFEAATGIPSGSDISWGSPFAGQYSNNSGFDANGNLVAVTGSQASGYGVQQTGTFTGADGTSYTVTILLDCLNILSLKTTGDKGSGGNGGGSGNGGGGAGCDCQPNAPMPQPEPAPPTAAQPASQSAVGYARLEAHNYTTGASSIGGMGIPPALMNDTGNLYDAVNTAQGSGGLVWAKPGDEIQIIGEAKAAIIAGWTTQWTESVEQWVEPGRYIQPTPEREPKSAIDEINGGMTQLIDAIQANAATSEESAASSEEISSQAEFLKGTGPRFRLK